MEIKLSEKELLEKKKELIKEISKKKSGITLDIILSILLVWTVIVPLIGLIFVAVNLTKKRKLEAELIEVDYYLSKKK